MESTTSEIAELRQENERLREDLLYLGGILHRQYLESFNWKVALDRTAHWTHWTTTKADPDIRPKIVSLHSTSDPDDPDVPF